MIAFKSPQDIALSIAEERRMYRGLDDFRLDVRLAERGGDDAAIADAKAAFEIADREWYEAWKVAKADVHAALDGLGFDAAAIKMYL